MRSGLRWPLSTRQMWLFERPMRRATCETGRCRHGLSIVSVFSIFNPFAVFAILSVAFLRQRGYYTLCINRAQGVFYTFCKFLMSKLAEKLKELRGEEAQGIFAARLGLKQAVYCHYEKGRREPSLDQLAHIAMVLQTTTDALLGIDQPPSSSVAVRGSAVSPGRQPTTNSPTNQLTNQPPTTKSAPGTLPQCARCEHRKLADKMRKMIGKG